MLTLTIDAAQSAGTIDRNVYGHFAEHLGRCIYEGIWVGEDSPIAHTRGFRNDVLRALGRLNIPILRWPGGCFADEYHWRDGIGPRDKRAPMVNTHWGGVLESNVFGTHEFLDLCELIGAEPYISGNVGSGTVQEMQQWVEYITHPAPSPMADLRRENGREKPWPLTYFGVGNENWGCGGSMRPQFYADLYRQFQTYLRNFGGGKLFKIACGANNADYDWTDVLMERAGRHLHGLSLHYYTVAGPKWDEKGPAVGYDERLYFEGLRKALVMDELVTKHGAIMDKYDPDKRVAIVVDEWGMWHDPTPGTNPGFLEQQNTIRDALVAALTLHIFHEHNDRVKIANLAQTINVLQAVVLTDDAKMILTPTYHVFDLLKGHQGATRLAHMLEDDGGYEFDGGRIPQISAAATRDARGDILLSVCNTHPRQSAALTCRLPGITVKAMSARTLAADSLDAHNDFNAPNRLEPTPFSGAVLDGERLQATLPPLSVTALQLSVT